MGIETEREVQLSEEIAAIYAQLRPLEAERKRLRDVREREERVERYKVEDAERQRQAENDLLRKERDREAFRLWGDGVPLKDIGKMLMPPTNANGVNSAIERVYADLIGNDFRPARLSPSGLEDPLLGVALRYKMEKYPNHNAPVINLKEFSPAEVNRLEEILISAGYTVQRRSIDEGAAQ